MQDKTFLSGPTSGLEARYLAQKIAFGPVTFQAVRVARDRGVLAAIAAAGDRGCSPETAAAQSGMSVYAVRVLCESALSVGVVDVKESAYVLTEVGHFILHDALTRANMDFVNDVCYEALRDLEPSLHESRPVGLGRFGDWPTLYPGLGQLPEKAREAWFRFDHIYSDSAFPAALAHVAKIAPRRLLDVGGNTGRWSICCAKALPELSVTIADLPMQLAMARKAVAEAGLGERVDFLPIDVLGEVGAFREGGYDVVWMSQFLCCFSEDQIVRILTKAKRALAPGGQIMILDTFWDRQRFDIAAFCIINTSPYFTCIANGNSRMYRFDDMVGLLAAAELTVTGAVDGLGLAHTLIMAGSAQGA